MTIKIDARKEQKQKIGLYVDESLHEYLTAIAQDNDISLNQTVIALVAAGIDALTAAAAKPSNP